MKSNLLLILKTNIINAFKLKKTSKKKKILIGVFAIYIIGTLFVTFSVFLKGLFEQLQKQNLTTYFLILVFVIASLFAFFFSIYSAKAGLFENKDNDLLLSLPIKRSTILLSRLLYLTLYNLIIGLVFIIPGLYIYITNISNLSMSFYVSIGLLILLFPIIPTIFASLFGYLIAFLTSKTQAKNMFELLYYSLFVFIYIYVMLNSNALLEKLTNNVPLMNLLLKIFFFPMMLISKGIIENNLFYILLFVLINLGILWVFIFALNKSYYKIIGKLNSIKTKSNFKMGHLTLKSKIKALKQKELKRYFSSAIYVFNTAFGVIFLIIGSIASFFYPKEKLLSLISSNSGMNFNSFTLVFAVVLFVIAMTNTTNSSISIERTNFWILKSLPLKTKEIFNAKLFVNKIILLPFCIISLFVFALNGYIDYTQMLLLMIITYFYNGFIANFGLIVNLLFPSFDALNDTVIVKQSTSSFIGIIVPFIVTIIGIGLIVSSAINTIDLLCIIIAISVTLYFITKIILSNWGEKRFAKIG